jgi:hypothetical protein
MLTVGILGLENLALSLRIAAMVVPVAAYFLILGLLNSRPHPQMLRGRFDFALLLGALGPLFFAPMAERYAGSPALGTCAVVGIAVGIMLLAPGGKNWVIYNLSHAAARKAVEESLESLGAACEPVPQGFRLSREGAMVRIGGFPLLRNVTVHLLGGSDELARNLESAMTAKVSRLSVEPSSASAAMLLIATAMIVAPLAMVAHRGVPELVRILTDLMH